MTAKHSIKRQLIASILCLCLCFTSLIGTTFAWFTDEVTSSGNIIQTGTLDVEMHWADGGEAVPTDKSGWTNAASGEMFNYTKWEPGYTEAKHIKISNVGTLSLKYQLRIVSSSELTKLADVIDVYYYDTATAVTRDSLSESDRLGTLAEVIDASHSKALFKTVRGSLESGDVTTLTLVLKMREGAGNEYQGLYLNGGFSIQLLAAQYTSDAESDSFDNMYDENAQYPVVTTPAYVLPTDKFTAFSFNTTDMKVTAPADFAAELADAGVTALTFKASDVVVKDGVATIASAEFYDQNGKVIDLANNSEPITVKLYVGDAYKGQSVVVSHDDKIVASTTVDDEGYVTYNTTHFCKITVELGKEIPEGSIIVGGEIVEKEDIPEDKPLTDVVDMIVGSHTYKVSYGMFKSWYEYPNVPGKIEADIYLPEDLYAFSMMYKNGDLTETGSHSDLKIMADLDFAGKKWEPIGRFFTNIHGNDHTISNLSDSFLGCVYDCQVYNLTLKNVNVSASAAGIIAKELAGDAQIKNVTIAGNNSVTYVDDGKTNWPESGYGIGAIAGVSLVGCSAPANVDVTITGTVTLNYGENAIFYNATGMANLGVSKELGLNVYMPNAGVTVTGSENITTSGNYYMLIADGVAINGKTYALLNKAGLEWFANKVNSGDNMKDYTVNLLADVDLENEEWTPIGYMGKSFQGTFDGNNHTVSNLKITKTLTNTTENKAIGFFGYTLDTAVIKNLVIENADVTGSLYVGVVAGHAYTGKSIENVTVKGNIFVDAWWYAGVIGGNGYMHNIENCRVLANPGSYVKGNNGSYIGAIWGFHGENKHYINNCYAENIDIFGVDRVGAISGISHYGNEITNCTAKNITVTATDPEATTIGLVVGACEGTMSEPSIFNNNELINVRAFAGYTEVYNIYGTNINGGAPVTNIADIDTVYINAAWAGYEDEKIIGAGKIFGVNAFASLTDFEVADETTAIVIYGGTYSNEPNVLSNTLFVGNVKSVTAVEGTVVVDRGNLVFKTSTPGEYTVSGSFKTTGIEGYDPWPTWAVSGITRFSGADGVKFNLVDAHFVSSAAIQFIGGEAVIDENSTVKLDEKQWTQMAVYADVTCYGEITLALNNHNGSLLNIGHNSYASNKSVLTLSGEKAKLVTSMPGSTEAQYDVKVNDNATFNVVNGATAEIGGYAVVETENGQSGTLNVDNSSNFTVGNLVVQGATVVTTVDELKAALGQGGTIIFANDITVTDKWDSRNIMTKTNTVNINGMGYTLKIAGKVNDGYNFNSVLRFETDATVKNLTMDLSEVVNDGRWLRAISSYGNLTVDNCTFIGPNDTAISTTRAIEYGDLRVNGKLDFDVAITNSTFTGWARAISDNESGEAEVANVVVDGNTFNCPVYLSAHESIVFTDNICESIVDLRSYLNGAELTVTATGNTLNEAADCGIGASKYPVKAANVTAQDGFEVFAN